MTTHDEWTQEMDTLGAEIRESLAHEQAAYVRWEPRNGTAYELVIVPWEVVQEAEEGVPTMFGGQMGPGWVWIARLHTAAVYPLRLWEEDGQVGGRCPHPSYFAEHWAKGSRADGAALHLLLSAVAGVEPLCSPQDADVELAMA